MTSNRSDPPDGGPETAVFRTLGLGKSYRLGRVDIPALSGVDLAIRAGETVAVAGPSGSGKSTLLHLLGCLDEPDVGRLEIEGRDVTRLGEGERTRLRRRSLGFVFQAFNLIPTLTALENVEYPLWIGGTPRRERRERARAMLEAVGLAERAGHRPDQLSGGQRQRVAVARALVHRPRAVLADEPTGNLDSATGAAIMELLGGLNRELGTTLVVATHDPRVMALAERRITLRDGRILEDAAA